MRMVKEYGKEVLYRDYTATMLKMIAETMVRRWGGKFEAPSYIEMTHEKEKQKTAKEILERTIKLFST